MSLTVLLAVCAGLLVLLLAIVALMIHGVLVRGKGRESGRTAVAKQNPSASLAPTSPSQPAKVGRTRRLVTDLGDEKMPTSDLTLLYDRLTFSDVERRLDSSFSELQDGKISMDEFYAIILREEEAVLEAIKNVSDVGADDRKTAYEELRRDAALTEFCRNWVETNR